MPTYCYETESGVSLEKVFPIGKAPKSVVHEGKVAKRSFLMESVGVPPKTGWPITCYASGVNAEQAGELRDHLRREGVPTEVTRDGDPVYRNAKHRRKALKARGMVDKSSYV